MVSPRAMEDRIGSRMGPWRQRPWRGDVGALSEAVNKSHLPRSLNGGSNGSVEVSALSATVGIPHMLNADSMSITNCVFLVKRPWGYPKFLSFPIKH